MEVSNMVEVMEAYVSGEPIQMKSRMEKEDLWSGIEQPSWNWGDYIYRISMEKSDSREINWEMVNTKLNYIARDSDGGWYGFAKAPTLGSKSWNTQYSSDYCIELKTILTEKFFGKRVRWEHSLMVRPGFEDGKV